MFAVCPAELTGSVRSYPLKPIDGFPLSYFPFCCAKAAGAESTGAAANDAFGNAITIAILAGGWSARSCSARVGPNQSARRSATFASMVTEAINKARPSAVAISQSMHRRRTDRTVCLKFFSNLSGAKYTLVQQQVRRRSRSGV